MAASRFSNKDDARTAVWDRLQVQRLARFPFPPHGRIPISREPTGPRAACSNSLRGRTPSGSRSTPMLLNGRSGRKPFDEGFRSMCRRRGCAAASCCSIPP